MKEDSYIVIQAFMLNELHLKGNELIVYAAIYGFTQDGEHWYYGTKGYLADWCGATKGTIGNCLRLLVEKGYIERRERVVQGQTKIEYRATKNATPPTKICNPPHTNFDPINNLEDKTNDNASNNKDQAAMVDAFTSDPRLRDMLMAWMESRRQMKAPLTDKALTMALNKLARMSDSNEERALIVEQSVVNGWKGLFKLKGGTRKVDAGGDVSQYNYF